MSAIPAKTGIPNLTNIKLANTVDFHISSTNFNNIVDKYANYLALAKYYNRIQHEADPIVSEVKFWEGVANANINLQTFAKNPKATKYLKRVETELEPNESLQLDNGGNPIIFIDGEGNLLAKTNLRDVPLTKEDTTVEEKINKISTGFDLGTDRTGEFIAWWLEKYRRAHFKVKELLAEKMNIEDTILQEISESVGLLFTQHLYPRSRDQHYTDEDSEPTPFPFGGVIDDRLDLDTKTNILGLSRRTEAIFRRNMKEMITTAAISTDSHGENLVTDHLHNARIAKNEKEITENIATTLGGTYNLLLWLSMNRVSNKQKMAPGVFQVVVENAKVEVDCLLNKIQTLKDKPFTLSMLS